MIDEGEDGIRTKDKDVNEDVDVEYYKTKLECWIAMLVLHLS